MGEACIFFKEKKDYQKWSWVKIADLGTIKPKYKTKISKSMLKMTGRQLEFKESYLTIKIW